MNGRNLNSVASSTAGTLELLSVAYYWSKIMGDKADSVNGAQHHDGGASQERLERGEKGQKQAEYAARVWELYNEGRPMYSRRLLEDLQQQLDERPPRTSFSLTCLGGERRSVPWRPFDHEGETWCDICPHGSDPSSSDGC